MRSRLAVLATLAAAVLAAPVPASGHVVTRPHAKRPLTDAHAARLVRPAGEIRPDNLAATHRTPTAAQLRAFRRQSDMPYARYVTGRFTGTTDEVLQWAAIKWGFRPDLLRAVATVESWWHMSTVGDGGNSFGLFQVRRPYSCTGAVCEQFRSDAAFNADYYGGILRAYYDGRERWLNDVRPKHGRRYRRGDIWGSVGAWYAGRWWNGAARRYVRGVKRALAERTWRRADFRSG